jgi:hypothetical protein
MRNPQRFNFTEGFDAFGVSDALPQLPLSLNIRFYKVVVSVTVWRKANIKKI